MSSIPSSSLPTWQRWEQGPWSQVKATCRKAHTCLWPIIAPALQALAALAAAAGLNAFLMRRYRTLSLPVMQVLVGCAMAAVITKVAYALFALWQGKPPVIFSFHVEKQMAGLSLMNVIGLMRPNILIHEGGHALMAALFYRHPAIEVLIKPFMGGATSYTTAHGLNAYAKHIGTQRVALLCIAGGIIATTVVAMIEFAAAWQLRGSKPLVADLLTWHGLVLLLNDILYGLTTFFTHHGDLSHDFMALWQQYGIHPAAVLAVIVLLVALEVAALVLYDRWRLKQATAAALPTESDV